MFRRALGVAVAVAFVAATVSAAQFGQLKKKPAEKKEEKTQTTESTQTSSTASSATMKAVNWAENGITFDVPDNWQQLMMQRDVANFMLMGADSAGISITISRMGANFPAEKSLKANRDDAAKKKENKEYVSFEDHPVGKVKGVMWIEAEKPSPDDVRRLTWIGFQKKGAWNQVTVHLSAKSGAFARHEATFRKVLESLKIESE